MNYKRLKSPTEIGKLQNNTKFLMDDGTTICHFLDGKVYVNGIEYGSGVPTLGCLSGRLTSNPLYLCYPLHFNKAIISSYGRHLHKNDRLERAQLRRKQARESGRNKSYDERPHGDSTCGLCGGQMSWCSCCRVYSSNCCQDWGTCMCS